VALPRKLAEEFNDFTKWWNYHSDKVSGYPMERRLDFFMNALNQQNYLLVELARAVNETRAGANGSVLALPNLNFGGRAP
jgi:hypothetical protein